MTFEKLNIDKKIVKDKYGYKYIDSGGYIIGRTYIDVWIMELVICDHLHLTFKYKYDLLSRIKVKLMCFLLPFKVESWTHRDEYYEN